MFWSLLFNLILLILIIHICLGAFKYVKVSLFHHYLIPVYSLIMFVITMRWNKQDLMLLAVLVIVGILLGLLETASLTFRKKPSAKKKSGWQYEMRRGWPYIIGWAAVILIGLVLSDLIKKAGFYHLFVDRIFEDLFEEISPLLFFTESHPWYIWALSGISSIVFAWRGTSMLHKQEDEGTIQILQPDEESEN